MVEHEMTHSSQRVKIIASINVKIFRSTEITDDN